MPKRPASANRYNQRKDWKFTARQAFGRYRGEILSLLVFLLALLPFLGSIMLEYLDHRQTIRARSAVAYEYVGKSAYSVRGGRVFSMTIHLKNGDASIVVSKAEFEQLDAGLRPAVYLSPAYGMFSLSQLRIEERNTRILGSIAGFVALVLLYRFRGGTFPFDPAGR